MSDNEMEEWIGGDNEDSHVVHLVHHNSISPWNKEYGGVTTLYKCAASDARGLYIFDIAYKLLQTERFDIGGAYTSDEGLWFFFTTSMGPSGIYLMNIFVSQRKPGTFALAISSSSALVTTTFNTDKVRALSVELEWKQFKSSQPDEVHYVKTFQFSEEDRKSLLKMVLVIPILIDMNSKSMLNKDVIQKIKADHSFGEDLFKDIEPDFIVVSNEGTQFKVHKVVLAAHSLVLKQLLKANETKSLILNNTNNDIELLLEFLYTGNIKDIFSQSPENLLHIAANFQLETLSELVKHSMKVSVSSENALDFAVIAEKYNCNDVQKVAFEYIANHPKVLDTEAFSRVNNAVVVKELLRYIHLRVSRQ